jgi:hypothetical protein
MSEACGPAPAAANYPDLPTTIAALQAHAKANGYALVQRDARPRRALFVCDRAGKYNPKGKKTDVHPSRKRKNTGSKKCGCMMRVSLIQDLLSGQWETKVLEGSHNHGSSADATAHPAHRIAATTLETRASINELAKSGLKRSDFVNATRTTH